MKRHPVFLACFAFLMVLFSCNSEVKDSDDYQNKDVQTVAVDEIVRIYYTTNSCCGYCSPNKDDLNHLEYIGEENIIPAQDDCDGCSYTEALLFKATSVGTDTILGCVHAQSVDCSDSLNDLKSFVVHVK